MPIRSAGAAVAARKKKERLTEAEEEEFAAVKIQSVWKGKQERRFLQQKAKTDAIKKQAEQSEALLDQLRAQSPEQDEEQREEQQREDAEFLKKEEEDRIKEKKERRSQDEGAAEDGYEEIERASKDQPPPSFRYKVYLILEDPTSSKHAQITSVVILTTILFSIACFMVETMPDFKDVPSDTWLIMELICTVVFTLEYVIRLMVCDVVGTSQWKFIREPMNICDFLAILPFYVQLIGKAAGGGEDMGIFRAIKLSRLLRIFKLARYSSGMRLMAEALTNSFRALSVLLFFLCIGIVLFSSSLYNAERISCPSRADLAKKGETEKYILQCLKSSDGWSQDYGLCCDEHDSPNDFPSIIEGFWWSIVTMTTVGFGDVYPRTGAGKIVGIFTMLAGLLLISLPVAIVGRKFQEVYEEHFHSDSQPGEKGERHHHIGKETLSDDGAGMKEMARKIRRMKITTRDGKSSFDAQIQELAEYFDTAETMARAAHIKQLADVNREMDILDTFESFLDIYKASMAAQREKFNPT